MMFIKNLVRCGVDGIAFDPDLVYYGNYSIGSGGEALLYLFLQWVTANFAFNDEIAFGIYKEEQKEETNMISNRICNEAVIKKFYFNSGFFVERSISKSFR